MSDIEGMILRGRRILLGICGSIAAYKVPILVRLLKKAGADVRVIMTRSAHQFVTQETLSTLSEQVVYTSFYKSKGVWANHVSLGLWAEHFLIAPLSADTMAKMVHGHCDSLLLAVYLSARCGVSVAPAMDEDMYIHFCDEGEYEVFGVSRGFFFALWSGFSCERVGGVRVVCRSLWSYLGLWRGYFLLLAIRARG